MKLLPTYCHNHQQPCTQPSKMVPSDLCEPERRHHKFHHANNKRKFYLIPTEFYVEHFMMSLFVT